MSDSFTLICPHCQARGRIDRAGPVPVKEALCGNCRQPLFTGKPVKVDEAAFDRHIAADLPVIVDFSAAWCGPCQVFASTFERLAASLEPNVRLLKVDTDAEKTLSDRYEVRTLPSVLFLKGGEVMSHNDGAPELWLVQEWADQCAPPAPPAEPETPSET